MMMIRQENHADWATVQAVVKEAFSHAAHSDGNEAELVAALRQSDAFIPELSLVAQADGNIVGHILFTRAYVDGQAVLALAPLAVLPQYQRRGIGGALIEEGHRIAKTLAYPYSVVLGSETYYPRFGYRPAELLGIHPPFEVESKNFMAIQLQSSAPPVKGVLCYAKEFGL